MKNTDKICRIVCAGENFGYDFKFLGGDLIIAVDGGLKYLKDENISPDIFIGDCDSLSLPQDEIDSKTIIKLAVKKDETDTYAAACEGLKRGEDNFYIYCGTGGEIDHTIANIQTVVYLAKNKKNAFLFDGKKVITAISGGEKLEFSDKAKGKISIFCADENCSGVNIKGLLYSAENLTLTNDFPLAARNEFVGEESLISVKTGCILVVFDSEEIKNLR